MKINTTADFSDISENLSHCTGDVYFDTKEGDHLNLKSSLSQLIFLEVILKKADELKAEIICENEADYQLLSKYFL